MSYATGSPAPDVLPALRREWLTTLVVLLGGFLLAIALGAYLAISARIVILDLRKTVAARIAAEEHLCPVAIDAAKALGILPAYAKGNSDLPRRLNVPGRYLCIASTEAAEYGIFADLSCNDVHKKGCVSLFAVTQSGGAVIYKRP